MIHLGSACHEMEQRGIETKRGDYNRAVSALNQAKEQCYKIEKEAVLSNPKNQSLSKQYHDLIQIIAEKANKLELEKKTNQFDNFKIISLKSN